MRSKMRDAVGYTLIGAAVIGAVLPIVPTVPFLLAAAAVLGREHPAMRRVTGLTDRLFARARGGSTAPAKAPPAE